MIEDAVAQVFGTTTKLVTATPDAPQLAAEAMNEGRWPLLGKLHGDFRSRRLKNIREELRSQDAQLRQALIDGCRRLGLAVVGYSGRDASVMDALTEAIADGAGYPHGLFWFHRGEADPLPHVRELLDEAAAAGIKTALISSETFDELMADLLVLEQQLPDDVAALLAAKRKNRLTGAPVAEVGNSFPVIRLNAVPVVSWPQTARLVECRIGGTREVRDAIAASGAEVIAARRAVASSPSGRTARYGRRSAITASAAWTSTRSSPAACATGTRPNSACSTTDSHAHLPATCRSAQSVAGTSTFSRSTPRPRTTSACSRCSPSSNP